MGSLSPPEYAVLTEYYDWLEKRTDIGLDLIGKHFIDFNVKNQL